MTTPARPDVALVALARAWRDEDPDLVTRSEVDALLAADDLEGLRARFGERLQFGTAGLRGAIGAGPNRMNRALVRRATAGVAAWLRAQGHDGVVVLGRDARHGSTEFEADAAAVLAGAGFVARVLPRPLPTPVLAFAIRHVGAVAGIMITASHNPREDNGYKLYLGDGAQIVPPVDDEISAAIDAIGPLADVPLRPDAVEVLGEDVVEAYERGAVALLADGSSRELRWVYTAMHGVGAEVVHAVFRQAGFAPPDDVLEQVEPDPDFPTVAFPNPEEPGALDLALARATAGGADVVIANDPDADRLALAVPRRDGAGWRALSGDELGALLADHLLRRGTSPHDVVVTTVVSSRLLAVLAADAGVTCREALTGFKWVVRAPEAGERFRFGYEEALGYCVGELVRDKDGIGAALVAAELVAELRDAGLTVHDRLDELHRRHGAHVTSARSVRVEGADWLVRVTAAMASLRATPPAELAGRAVQAVEDLLPGGRLPPSDVLIWTLDGARLVVRPSGTEPKLKCYAEAVVPVGADDDVEAARTAGAATTAAVLDAVSELLVTLGL